MDRPITIAVAGCGSRGLLTYSRLIAERPDEARIVAAADQDPEKLAAMRRLTGIGEEACFSSVEEMLAQPRLADAILICTQDRSHFGHARAALMKDYDLLLEKPLSTTAEECLELSDLAQKRNRRVVVCHVLRYTVFFQTLKRLIDEGVIGDTVNVEAFERVCYWHQAHSFVRGNWRNSEESSCMILAKCCHDLDIILWLTGKRCKRVSSFGDLHLFRQDKAPEGSAARCVDCAVESCPFNAVDYYLKRFRESGNDWPQNVVAFEPTEEKLLAALRDGPYGRCVYRCDNDVVDHQTVNMELEDGSTATLTMTGFTAHEGRLIRIGGTMGELYGDMHAETIHVMRYGQPDEVIDLRQFTSNFSGHGGGDAGLMRDFLALLRGEDVSGGTLTSIDRSVESHIVALAAERSRLNHGESVTLF